MHKEQLPFLGGPPRLAVRAVKAAVFAFMGAQRTALTEEAGGLGAGFRLEGQIPGRNPVVCMRTSEAIFRCWLKNIFTCVANSEYLARIPHISSSFAEI